MRHRIRIGRRMMKQINYRFLKFIAFLHDANTAILYSKYIVHDICGAVL